MPAKPTEPAANATELKAHEVAWLAGVSTVTVYNMIRRGDVVATWNGGRVRVARASVDAYLAKRAVEAA